MSWSQLTFIFFRGVAQPPTSNTIYNSFDFSAGFWCSSSGLFILGSQLHFGLVNHGIEYDRMLPVFETNPILTQENTHNHTHTNKRVISKTGSHDKRQAGNRGIAQCQLPQVWVKIHPENCPQWRMRWNMNDDSTAAIRRWCGFAISVLVPYRFEVKSQALDICREFGIPKEPKGLFSMWSATKETWWFSRGSTQIPSSSPFETEINLRGGVHHWLRNPNINGVGTM